MVLEKKKGLLNYEHNIAAIKLKLLCSHYVCMSCGNACSDVDG